MTTVSPKLKVVNGVVYANSLDLANQFHRRHEYILNVIKTAISLPNIWESNESDIQLVKDFSQCNFAQREYKNKRGRIFQYYEMTEAGFYSIALAFTGENARLLRIRYINKFKAMERELRTAHARIETLENLEMFPEMLREREYTVAEVLEKLALVGLFNSRTTASGIKSKIKRGEIVGRFDGTRYVIPESSLKSFIKRKELEV